MDLQPGSSFGPYRIVAPLGRGGMATVYRAHDPALDRDVALKVLPAEFLHDPAFAERFRQEARVAARLEHPHVVPIHNFGIEGGRPWMAMRLVTGGSLAGRVARGPLVPREAAALLADVAGALDYAHGRGVVHRDVKPANVLLDEAGRAYLADFGVAKMLEGSSIATATGLIQGTPSYMAPEQAMGAKVDHLADVYALGVMAFECLTGRVPYTGTTPVAILMKHVQEPVPEPTAAEVAPQLAAVLRRCLAKTPSERWPTAGAFTAALGQAAAGVTPAEPVALPTLTVPPTPVPGATRRPTPARPAAPPPGRSTWRWAAAGGVAALAVLAVAGGLLVRGLLRTPAAPAASPGPVVTAESPSPSPTAVRPERAAPATPPPVAVPTPRPARPSAAPTPVPATPEPTPTPVATPVPTPTPVPPEPAALPAGLPPEGVAPPVAPPRSGRIRVYCEAKLEPVLFRKADEKDVADSLKDLKEAIEERGVLEVVPRHEADAVVQVLERGREPAVIGMRKVRVRVVLGGQSVELTGRDSLKGFNTWGGAAKGAAKQVESWLKGRLEPSE